MPPPVEALPPVETGFDPLVFWIKYRRLIVMFVALFVIALLIAAIAQYLQHRKKTASQELFARAQGTEDYRKVIAEFPDMPVAGNARLLLADKLRAEGKLDEAAAELRTFTEKQPEHPLISGAWTSLAATLEAQNKPEEALGVYQRVATQYPNTFSVPVALMAQARILRSKEKREEAKRIFEQVMTSFPESQFAAEAERENRLLKK